MKKLSNMFKQPSDTEKIVAIGLIIAFAIFFFLLSFFDIHKSASFPIFFTAIVVGITTNMYGIKPWLGWQHATLMMVIGLLTFTIARTVL